jgi:peptide/nickel transport system ATP-binding protein
MSATDTLVTIDRLCTHVRTPAGPIPAVDGVSLAIPRGRTVALVGESGCGKSLTALSILRLLPSGARIVSGRIRFDGQDLAVLSERELRAVRGGRIAIIFQEPLTALHPLLSIGRQLLEPLELHERLGRRARLARAEELLARVGIPRPRHCLRQYPHELSGGMRQRAMIAMALAGRPELLIADEPTTALDPTIQLQILELLAELQRETHLAILLVTHDLGVVAHFADEACVMYCGRIVERGPAQRVLTDPRHPYTRALLGSLLTLTSAQRPVRPARDAPARRDSSPTRDRLPVIAGQVPSLLNRPPGCAFHPRCAEARGDPLCRTREPELLPSPTAAPPTRGDSTRAERDGPHGGREGARAEQLHASFDGCACWHDGRSLS